jgi:hypothetical protein
MTRSRIPGFVRRRYLAHVAGRCLGILCGIAAIGLPLLGVAATWADWSVPSGSLWLTAELSMAALMVAGFAAEFQWSTEATVYLYLRRLKREDARDDRA